MDSYNDESLLISAINTILGHLQSKGVLYFRRIHVEGVRTGHGGRRKNPMRGIFDYMIMYNGQVGFLEAKTKTGSLSPEQQKFQTQCNEMRIPNGVARNPNDLFQFLIEQLRVPICQTY